MMMLIGSAEAVPEAPKEKVVFAEDMPAVDVAALQTTNPGGLTNLGNTCFLNSSLQCMKAIPELSRSLAQYSADASPDPFVPAMRNIVSQLERSNAAREVGRHPALSTCARPSLHHLHPSSALTISHLVTTSHLSSPRCTTPSSLVAHIVLGLPAPLPTDRHVYLCTCAFVGRGRSSRLPLWPCSARPSPSLPSRRSKGTGCSRMRRSAGRRSSTTSQVRTSRVSHGYSASTYIDWQLSAAPSPWTASSMSPSTLRQASCRSPWTACPQTSAPMRRCCPG